MNWIVIGYFTKNTFYEKHAGVFIKSLERLNIPYYVEGIDNLGSWYKNTLYKPTFIKQMLKKFPDKNIVYVDCDAEFMEYPILFDNLGEKIAVHLFEQSLYNKNSTKKMIASGTIFLPNNSNTYNTVLKWEKQCKDNPNVWDQTSLELVLMNDYDNLPAEYLKIFDTMRCVENPIIVHYQASRKVKNKH